MSDQQDRRRIVDEWTETPEGQASYEAMTDLFLRLFDPKDDKPSKKPARRQP